MYCFVVKMGRLVPQYYASSFYERKCKNSFESNGISITMNALTCANFTEIQKIRHRKVNYVLIFIKSMLGILFITSSLLKI